MPAVRSDISVIAIAIVIEISCVYLDTHVRCVSAQTLR